MSPAPSSPFRHLRALSFLGRVRFTLFLLLAGALAFAVGTIVESRGGREAAWAQVYGRAWFDLLLLLIAVNLVGAVVVRWPIQRHQWGFVLTHLSIVLLLVGAWISRTYGYEGRLAIAEGGEEDVLVLDGVELTAAWGEDGAAERFELPPHGRVGPRRLNRASEALPELLITRHLADGLAHREILPGEASDPPAAAVRITGPRTRLARWLFAGEAPIGGHGSEHPSVALVRGRPELSAVASADEALLLELPGREQALRLPVTAGLGEEIDCGEGVRARVTRFLRRARLVDGELVEPASAPPNPVAVLELSRGELVETHVVFANHPDHPTLTRSAEGERIAARVRLHAHGREPGPAVIVGVLADGSLSAAFTGAERPIRVLEGRPAALGDLGLVLEVERLLPHARRELRVEPAPPGREGGRAFLLVTARSGDELSSRWVGLGSEAAWPVAGRELRLTYGRRTRELPFSVELHDFELATYPGSSRPAQFSSAVTVRVPGREPEASEHVISMNRPLDVAGFRLFQSSYQLGGSGRPDVTILSVSRDPGVPIVYLAFALTCLGIAWYVRRRTPVRDEAAGAGPLVLPPRRTPAAGEPRGRRAAVGLLLLAAILPAAAPEAHAQSVAAPGALPVEATRGWAILADGRTKPLRTFADETALRVTGRESLGGRDSLELLWAFVLAPREALQQPWVRVDSLALKEAMQLDPGAKRHSMAALLGDPGFRSLVDSGLQALRSGGEPGRLEKDALEVHSKLALLDSLLTGQGLTIVPSRESSGWLAPDALRGSTRPEHLAVVSAYARLRAAYGAGDPAAFEAAAAELTNGLRAVDPAAYPAAGALKRELLHEDLNAFGKAWVLYLLAFLAFLFLATPERPWGHVVAQVLLGAGFLLQVLGIGLRWAIAGRAPVSNMYESLVFMGAGAIALGLVPEVLKRTRWLGVTAGLVGFLTLVFAENLPIDSTISPLVPVLANTYWLSVHVMTIMLSYSAFALAMALGHVLLAVQLFQPARAARIDTLTVLLDKMLQVGVLFLAAGIACGAVWANESWGRYWGWDPKETWSLITFFVYLAVVHARYAGWLRSFGLAAGSIVAFMSVVMTYYGVNFVLAAGMHSYGFAEGGRPQAAAYVLVELAILAAAWLKYRADSSAAAPAAGGRVTPARAGG